MVVGYSLKEESISVFLNATKVPGQSLNQTYLFVIYRKYINYADKSSYWVLGVGIPFDTKFSSNFFLVRTSDMTLSQKQYVKSVGILSALYD